VKYGFLHGPPPKKPVIAHEMGYFVSLSDLEQIELFHGGLRPYWLYKARQMAGPKKCSTSIRSGWRTRIACSDLPENDYEAARRAPGLSGYSQVAAAGFPGLCRRRGRYIFPTEGPECCGIPQVQRTNGVC